MSVDNRLNNPGLWKWSSIPKIIAEVYDTRYSNRVTAEGQNVLYVLQLNPAITSEGLVHWVTKI